MCRCPIVYVNIWLHLFACALVRVRNKYLYYYSINLTHIFAFRKFIPFSCLRLIDFRIAFLHSSSQIRDISTEIYDPPMNYRPTCLRAIQAELTYNFQDFTCFRWFVHPSLSLLRQVWTVISYAKNPAGSHAVLLKVLKQLNWHIYSPIDLCISKQYVYISMLFYDVPYLWRKENEAILCFFL